MSRPHTVVLSIAAAVTALVALPATAGAAAPTNAAPEAYLLTGTRAECDLAGRTGTEDGLFGGYRCRLGVAGVDLVVQPTASTTGRWTSIGLPTTLATCTQRGAAGASGLVWWHHTCRNGVAGYSLLVLG